MDNKIEPRYLLIGDFATGPEVKYYYEDVNQPFGDTSMGYSIYNALVLAIFNRSEIDAIKQTIDPITPQFGLSRRVTINGNIFYQSYIKGFNKGLNKFKERHIQPYGDGSKEFIHDILTLYKYGYVVHDGLKLGWLKQARIYGSTISKSKFYDWGYYAGLCYGVDEMVSDYPSLQEAIYIDDTESDIIPFVDDFQPEIILSIPPTAREGLYRDLLDYVECDEKGESPELRNLIFNQIAPAKPIVVTCEVKAFGATFYENGAAPKGLASHLSKQLPNYFIRNTGKKIEPFSPQFLVKTLRPPFKES